MRKMSIRLFIFLLIVCMFHNSISQTIINYQTWSGASGCNIFSTSTNVPATVNGTASNIAHLTAIGQPQYSVINQSIDLSANISNGMSVGTEYRVSYNFQAGYIYRITINAANSNPTSGPIDYLRLDLNSGGSGQNTVCTGPGLIDANSFGGYKDSRQITFKILQTMLLLTLS